MGQSSGLLLENTSAMSSVWAGRNEAIYCMNEYWNFVMSLIWKTNAIFAYMVPLSHRLMQATQD